MRSSSAHCDQELARRRGAEEEEKKKKKKARRAILKSNNPHLAGGEKRHLPKMTLHEYAKQDVEIFPQLYANQGI